jgi:hypothetical protein
MFTSIGAAVIKFCAALTMLFSAAEKGAKSLDHLAGWAEETAGAFADEARITRKAKHAALLTQTGVADTAAS